MIELHPIYSHYPSRLYWHSCLCYRIFVGFFLAFALDLSVFVLSSYAYYTLLYLGSTSDLLYIARTASNRFLGSLSYSMDMYYLPQYIQSITGVFGTGFGLIIVHPKGKKM